MTAFPLNDTNYYAEDLRLFHAGRVQGIINHTGNDFEVKAAGGMNITVSDGSAFTHTKKGEVGGVVYSPKQTTELTSQVADTTDRYDYVAIRYTSTSNQVSIVYQVGNMDRPTGPVRTNTQYDLVLAVIKVPANSGAISQENITDTRMDEKFCGLCVDTLTYIPTQGFQDQFMAFLERMQNALGEVPATNLQIQINELKARKSLIVMLSDGYIKTEDRQEGSLYFNTTDITEIGTSGIKASPYVGVKIVKGA